MQPPVFDIDPQALWADPYPVYRQMRAEAPICYVPQLDAVLLTRRNDIFACEKNVEVFSSEQPDGLMTKLMGENMMRKDGQAHAAERRLFFPAVAPKVVTTHWKGIFEREAMVILDELEPNGSANLVTDYAMRLSGEALKAITGLTQITWKDMDQWSQAMINGIANYADDPAIESRCKEATTAIDDAITERIPQVMGTEDKSLLGMMLNGGMPETNVRHNIKLTISGGQNEPRDAIAGATWALIRHPEQLAMVRDGSVAWLQAFEEYCRWIAPIGMSPRRIAKAYEFGGAEFEPDARAFLMFGSGNRDEEIFPGADVFDISRDCRKSISFGAGPHLCAGAWASRSLVADVALPMLFRRLENLRLADAASVRFGGWAFRGPLEMPVVWDE
jgi:cytochrome P450